MAAELPEHGALAHFAINADDVAAAQAFYSAVFGWRFTQYGPDFFRIMTAGGQQPGPIGVLQARRNLLPGSAPTTGVEGTIAVADIDAVAATVATSGGRILMEKATISGVGQLIFFADPSGNVVGAMQYE